MRIRATAVLAIIASVFSAPLPAQVCVDARKNTGTEDGTPERPCCSVQAGVAAAASGQTVQVATGTYAEDVCVENKVLSQLGGFAGGSEAHYASIRTAATAGR
jgi:hypothetical protein